MNGEHRVQRPEWTCAADGLPWPCEAARKLLTGAFDDPAALVLSLAGLMAQAADELGVEDPASLYRRFLGWTMAPGEVCRVCGSRRHALVAGVLRRLLPCRELPEVLATRPPAER